MHELHRGLEGIARLAAMHSPAYSDPNELHLTALDLHLCVDEFEIDALPDGFRCAVSYHCSLSPGAPGIVITAVGFGDSEPAATLDSASQWVLGVLPAVAAWRSGAHSCLVGRDRAVLMSPDPLTHQVLLGPILQRGDADESGWVDTNTYLELLRPQLATLSFWGPLHWLECFALRRHDGAVMATCRLDNRDWPAGEQILCGDAATWPGLTPTIHTRRQFILFAPLA